MHLYINTIVFRIIFYITIKSIITTNIIVKNSIFKSYFLNLSDAAIPSNLVALRRVTSFYTYNEYRGTYILLNTYYNGRYRNCIKTFIRLTII